MKMNEMQKVSKSLVRLAATIDKTAAGRVPDSLDPLIESAEAALAEAKQAERALVRRHKEERDAASGSIQQIQAALSELRCERRTQVRRSRKHPAHVSAGPTAMRRVTERLAEGACTQKVLIAELGLNPGSVSHALTALREIEAVEQTGEVIDGSREIRLVRGKVREAKSLYASAREIVQARPVRA